MDPASGGNSPTRHVLWWASIGFVPRTPPLISVQLCPSGFGLRPKIVTWLILPVVICLSQRLSHACLSISNLYGETANGSLNQLSFI